MRGPLTTTLKACAIVLLLVDVASAEVVGIDIRRRDDAGTHERIIGRVHFEVDPTLPANRGIADIDLAPRNARGKVEFASDVMFFRPKDAARARGTVFLEVVNRGRDQSLALMSLARQTSLAPESWSLGDRFVLDQGFTVAFLGWQFDVPPGRGLSFSAPVAPVDGVVRASYVEPDPGRRYTDFRLGYCAAAGHREEATLTFRARIDATPRVVKTNEWVLAPDGCSVHLAAGFEVGLYELVYQAHGSPVAGLGLAAIRDFASYLRYGGAAKTLREAPSTLRNVIGFGYSQSARLLREFVRDGFNADERGRMAFDGLMIASAGAGGGSFNHRFAMPGQAGNSVLSVLRPVDLPPFTDDGLLANARAAGVTPKIFYTLSSTEYWARAGSLTHTTEDGKKDVPPAPSSRLYFLAGTPHSAGGIPRAGASSEQYRQIPNFALQRWPLRALLLDLDAWVHGNEEPPPSTYPTREKGQLVAREEVRFPKVPSLPFPSYMPHVWRMDYGPRYQTERVITIEPPSLGASYQVLVPQVDADGNDVSGVRLPEVSVPLGSFTGWNVNVPQLKDLDYLAGLVGSFDPFPRTRTERDRRGDPRSSIDERYAGRDDYLSRVRQAALELVKQRFMLPADVPAVLQRASEMWDAIVAR